MTPDAIGIRLIVAGTAVPTLFALYLIGFILVQKKKQNDYHAEKDLQNYKYHNQILRVRLSAHEEAMAQISREIHDNISQLLGLTQANLYLLIDRMQNQEDAKLLVRVNTLVSQIITDMENAGHSLSSNFINKHGLREMLKNETEYINSSQQLACELSIEGSDIKINPEKEVLIFRIAQEAIHNALKHAQATKLTLQLKIDEHQLTLSVEDNGKGFDNNTHSSGGIGFINMNQRAQLLAASLHINSILNEGTKITLITAND